MNTDSKATEDIKANLERLNNNLERIANALEILAECTAVEYKGRIFCTSASVYNVV